MNRISTAARSALLGVVASAAVLAAGCGDNPKSEPKVKTPEGVGEFKQLPAPGSPGGETPKAKPGAGGGVQ